MSAPDEPMPRRRALACVYCGGEHASADEVKACWQRTNGAEVAPADEPLSLFEPDERAAQSETFEHDGQPIDPTPAGIAPLFVQSGPPSLGRNVIVAPGQPAPAHWAAAQRVVVQPGDPELVALLLRFSASRTGVVIQLDDAAQAALAEPFTSTLPPYAVGPRVRFTSEQLQHLVFSNAIDTRTTPQWAVLQSAVRAGAVPCPAAEINVRGMVPMMSSFLDVM